MKRNSILRWCSFAVVAAVVVPWQTDLSPARAQGYQMQQLINRMERMQAELTTLQRQVYQGGKGGRVAAPAPADPQARRLAARMSVRITQLEDELRRLTGKTEEFTHAVQQMRARFEKLVSDVEYRLTAIERGRATDAPPLAPGGAAGPGRALPPPGSVSGYSPGYSPGPQVLGTIRQGAPTGAGAVAARPPAPKLTPKEQYDHAHALIVKDQNFEQAERVLSAFIESYPNNSLAPNAHYWLGRTYFVRKDYENAAITFAAGFQKFPKSGKAPDNLLNLGMSLARLEKKKEACTTFSRLLKYFPALRDNVKRRVTRERRRLLCR